MLYFYYSELEITTLPRDCGRPARGFVSLGVDRILFVSDPYRPDFFYCEFRFKETAVELGYFFSLR